MWQKIGLLAMFGAAGTLARYGLGLAVQHACGSKFPFGTFVVNMVGCFLFGVIFQMGSSSSLFSRETGLIILIGFMGSFTTFSTFAFEAQQMVTAGQWMWLAANIGGQVAVGMVMVMLGIALGRVF